MPGNDVDWRVIDLGQPQVAEETRDQLALRFPIFEGGNRSQEVARVGEAIGADRAQVGQAEDIAEVLADVATRRRIGKLDAEAQSARDDDDLLWLGVDDPELGDEALPAVLRND